MWCDGCKYLQTKLSVLCDYYCSLRQGSVKWCNETVSLTSLSISYTVGVMEILPLPL